MITILILVLNVYWRQQNMNKTFSVDLTFKGVKLFVEANVATDLHYKKPSIDHIIATSVGGTNCLDNLQFLSWFENRCKNNMSQIVWDNIKDNIEEYFV